MRRTIPVAVFICLGLAPPALTSERMNVAGPVKATVLRIVDGDTLLVRAMPWPQHSVDVYVRMRGIDAPELKARCEQERFAARQARRALGDKVPEESEVNLVDISGDKYFGRVLADVRLADGSDPATDLLADGYVRPYQGGKRRQSFCY